MAPGGGDFYSIHHTVHIVRHFLFSIALWLQAFDGLNGRARIVRRMFYFPFDDPF